MPYSDSFERGAVERAAQSSDDYRRALGRAESMSQEERRCAIDKARGALISALVSKQDHLVRSLAEAFCTLRSAVDSVNFAERRALHSAAIPAVLPGRLPSGSAILYGTHHGQRFDGEATLRRAVISTLSYRLEPHDYYDGFIGGKPASVSWSEIDWHSLMSGAEQDPDHAP